MDAVLVQCGYCLMGVLWSLFDGFRMGGRLDSGVCRHGFGLHIIHGHGVWFVMVMGQA